MAKDNRDNERNYYIKGTWVSKKEANRIGLATIFGFIVTPILAFFVPINDKPTIFFNFAGCGWCWLLCYCTKNISRLTRNITLRRPPPVKSKTGPLTKIFLFACVS